HDAVVPSAAFFHLLIDQLLATPAVEILRRQTVLDETRAGLATVLLGDRLLNLLKSERILTRAEVLDFWNLEHQGNEIAGQEAQADTATDLRQQATPVTQRQLDDLAQRMQRDAQAAGRRLNQKAQQVRAAAGENVERNRARLDVQAQRVLQDLEESN